MEYPDYCITTMRACCKKGDYHGRQACRLDVEKAVLPESVTTLSLSSGCTQAKTWGSIRDDIEVVKRKDTGMYLRYIYSFRECPRSNHEGSYMRKQDGEGKD